MTRLPILSFLKTTLPLSVALGLLLGVASPASAQKYRTAIGLRLARPDLGLTITQRLARRTSLEVLGSAADNDLTLTALARQHTGILGHALNLYAGLGPHVGNTQDRGNYYGGTVVVGFEWKIPIFPIVFAYDWMPAISSSNRAKRFNNSTGISLRYVILREKRNGMFKWLSRDKKKDS